MICTSFISRASISLPSPNSEEFGYTSTLTLPGRRSSASFLNSNAPCPFGVCSATTWENLMTMGSAAVAIPARPMVTAQARALTVVFSMLYYLLLETEGDDSPDLVITAEPGALDNYHSKKQTTNATIIPRSHTGLCLYVGPAHTRFVSSWHTPGQSPTQILQCIPTVEIRLYRRTNTLRP